MPTPAHTPSRAVLADLKPDPKNARRHDDRNMRAITDSLTRFGQVEPLVVQASSGRVVGGNGRLEAMKALGWTHADVVEVALTDDEAIALAVALNRSGELATWDIGQLEKNLKSLRGELDLTLLGFDDGELRRLLKADQPLPEMPAAPAFMGGADEGDEDDDEAEGADEDVGGHTQPSPQLAAPAGEMAQATDAAPTHSEVRQPRPVQLYFEGDDAQAYFEVVDMAAECLGTRGQAETVLAALRRVTGQAIFPGA